MGIFGRSEEEEKAQFTASYNSWADTFSRGERQRRGVDGLPAEVLLEVHRVALSQAMSETYKIGQRIRMSDDEMQYLFVKRLREETLKSVLASRERANNMPSSADPGDVDTGIQGLPVERVAESVRSVLELTVGDRVSHQKFGLGTVAKTAGSGDKSDATIRFDTEGVKRMLLRYGPVERVVGAYTTAWPDSSGLGRGQYSEEAEQQAAYLIYSSSRRRNEGVASEDAASMSAAQSLLQSIGVSDQLLLIAGPVDLRPLNEPSGSEFAGQVAITDRTCAVWWQGRRGCVDEYVLLPHQNLQSKVTTGLGSDFFWSAGAVGDFPPPSPLRQIYGGHGLAVRPHLSSDGHANRRGLSVVATLQYVRGDAG